MAEKQGAVVVKGHEEGMKLVLSLLKEFGLPLGLLPLSDVEEVGYVKSTGYIWITQKKKTQHIFKLIAKQVSYETEITGYIEKNRISKSKGVKANKLFVWVPVADMCVDDPPTGKIHMKSVGGLGESFPVEAFAAGQ
eukprot:Gb_12297 [translate_table: standard]